MLISNNFYTQFNNFNLKNKNISTNNTLNNKNIGKDIVSFYGHFGSTQYEKDGIENLIHETGMFRDIQTKEFVKDYIIKNFSNKDKINILVGGCSTGEDVFSYGMLLNSLKDKVSIIGFDLSDEAVKDAKTGKVSMENRPDSFSDIYLCFDICPPKTEKEKKLKNLFDDFFDVPASPPKNIISRKVTSIKSSLMNKLYRYSIQGPLYSSKEVSLKPDKLKNIDFKVGDIMKLNEISNGEKADVITFSNALYHIMCEDTSNFGIRTPKPDAEDIIIDLAKQIKSNLNPNGIFVLGEDEEFQTLDSEIVPSVFKQMGFKPLNHTIEHSANIWQLVE